MTDENEQYSMSTGNPDITGSAWVCGDIHGELSVLQVALRDSLMYRKRNAKVTGEKVDEAHMILLGDVGLGFPDDPAGEALVRKMNRLAEMFRTTVYLIRGNHDNPAVWDSARNSASLPQQDDAHPRVVFLQDGPILVNGRRFLVIGGAASADVEFREPGRDWWEEEGVRVQSAFLGGGDMTGYYGILSHAGPRPSIVNPELPAMFLAAKDAIDREQVVLEYIGNALVPSVWYHGHYHRNNVDFRYFCNLSDAGEGELAGDSCCMCICTCLDIGTATPIL